MENDDVDQENVCPACGRHFDRPGFYGDCESSHPRPSRVRRLVEEIETCLTGRKHLYAIGQLGYDLQREIRDELEEVIDAFMKTETK